MIQTSIGSYQQGLELRLVIEYHKHRSHTQLVSHYLLSVNKRRVDGK